MLVQQLENDIQQLQNIIQTQAKRINDQEKAIPIKEEATEVVIKYRDVVNPNAQTLIMHEEMDTLHNLTIKLQLQINYLKSIQMKLITLLHSILSNISEGNNVEEQYDMVQNNFL